MRGIFKIQNIQQEENNEAAGVYIAIDLRVGEREAPFAVSRFCRTEKELESEADSIREDLDHALEEARAVLERSSSGEETVEFTPEMPAEQIWASLENIDDETLFIEKFNALDEPQRRDVAEHVLAECNVFKGKASSFSKRYNNETAYLE